MTPNANVDIFRKHYEDMIGCKNAINTNAETLNSNEENAIEALIPIINEYGREMVKKLVVNAVLQNRQNYNEHIRKWADNAIISKFIFETDNVLSDYVPDHLSEAALERIAEDIMDKEKNKQTIKSVQGTEYEVLMCSQYRSLLSITNPDNMTAYCTAIISSHCNHLARHIAYCSITCGEMYPLAPILFSQLQTASYISAAFRTVPSLCVADSISSGFGIVAPSTFGISNT